MVLSINRKQLKGILTFYLVSLPLLSQAEVAAAAVPETMDSNSVLRYVLSGILLLFLCVIAVLGAAVSSAGRIYLERKKAQERPGSGTMVLLLLALSLPATRGYAQGTAAATAGPSLPADIIILMMIIGLELVIILLLSRMLLGLLRMPEARQHKRQFKWSRLFQRLNQTVPVTEEQQLDLKHDYDGIRELDNKVPAWWQYGFYASILFAVLYLYRMFVSGSLPDQIQELQYANELAAVQKEQYLKQAANSIDEFNVVMLDAAGIAEGAVVYTKNCQACHGDKGQGGVGPNLTDPYWLHQGGIQDIFRSIKYGWQEKGMKAWKEDLSPVQIAQLTSFIRSLADTHPPAAKEPQGDLYTETKTAVDSAGKVL